MAKTKKTKNKHPKNMTITPAQCYELIGDYLNEYINQLIIEYMAEHCPSKWNDYEYDIQINIKKITYEK